jgi:Zn-dependent protease
VISPHIVTILFQIVVLLFAISLHEASHAWMASRLGDQTARMVGRVTLNPLKHIDPVGTVIVPLISLVMGLPMFGWAKPTPVNTRNFKKFVRDDILTTLAGPASNILSAIVALLVLIGIESSGPAGRQAVLLAVTAARYGMIDNLGSTSAIFPVALLFYYVILLNLFLAVFNLLPIPPLDGSHVVRHMLPYRAVAMYDRLGMISLVFILLFGGRLIAFFVTPALSAFDRVLLSL